MKALLPLALLGALSPVHAGGMPDMICRELRTLNVNPVSFQAAKVEDATLFRFGDGKLYLWHEGQPEYLYGKVRESEPMRYAVGHKTLLFTAPDYSAGMFVHSYVDEVRITHVKCGAPTAQ